jgi:hypothetical protein
VLPASASATALARFFRQSNNETLLLLAIDGRLRVCPQVLAAFVCDHQRRLDFSSIKVHLICFDTQTTGLVVTIGNLLSKNTRKKWWKAWGRTTTSPAWVTWASS